MSPRPRKHRDLEPNLYPRSGGGYRYRHPVTGKDHGMGSDKIKANAAARKLNALLVPSNDLVAKVSGARKLFRDVVTWYREKEMPLRKLSPKTAREYTNQLRHISGELGHLIADQMTVHDVAQFLSDVTQGARSRQQYRSLMMDVCATAISEGWMTENVADQTRARSADRQRMRLTREGYDAVYQCAPDWLCNAMDLSRITLQRREDIAVWRFDAEQNGRLLVEQIKTGKRLAIAIGDDLRRLLSRCRDDVVSPFIIHKLPEKARPRGKQAAKRQHYTQALEEQITRAFKEARDQSGYYQEIPKDKTPPTFHEIRSLGADLYQQAGWPETRIQALLGHSDIDMTRTYLAGHEVPYVEVDSGL